MLKKKETNENKITIIRGIGFLCVAIGLVYCTFTGQVETSGLEYMVYPVIFISAVLGLAQVIKGIVKGDE